MKTITLSDDALRVLAACLEMADSDGPADNPCVALYGEPAFAEAARAVGYHYQLGFDAWRESRRYEGSGNWTYYSPARKSRAFLITVGSDGLFNGTHTTLYEAERDVWVTCAEREYWA